MLEIVDGRLLSVKGDVCTIEVRDASALGEGAVFSSAAGALFEVTAVVNPTEVRAVRRGGPAPEAIGEVLSPERPDALSYADGAWVEAGVDGALQVPPSPSRVTPGRASAAASPTGHPGIDVLAPVGHGGVLAIMGEEVAALRRVGVFCLALASAEGGAVWVSPTREPVEGLDGVHLVPPDASPGAVSTLGRLALSAAKAGGCHTIVLEDPARIADAWMHADGLGGDSRIDGVTAVGSVIAALRQHVVRVIVLWPGVELRPLLPLTAENMLKGYFDAVATFDDDGVLVLGESHAAAPVDLSPRHEACREAISGLYPSALEAQDRARIFGVGELNAVDRTLVSILEGLEALLTPLPEQPVPLEDTLARIQDLINADSAQ